MISQPHEAKLLKVIYSERIPQRTIPEASLLFALKFHPDLPRDSTIATATGMPLAWLAI